MRISNFLVFILFFCTVSCNLVNDSPERIFQLIGLNANKIPSNYERVFKELRLQKENGSLNVPTEDGKSMKKANCVEFVKYFYGATFKEDLKKIKKLNPDKNAEEIVKAGLDLFEYADQIQTKDFPIIAKMIDDGKSAEDIDAAARNLDNTKGIEIDKKHQKVMDLLLPYADKNGVEYKRF
ncbi:hypothetical protein [Flavobacterium foetidum]|uniref:hypothetical protein n=1 Tax=Flavobacterium foetidum TaxID=2026681 RepID=UPI0010752997|nr:hypothetical protein [Flavobacterium foetidum]KAF2508286.1 hypothetical protein E0W73_19760 [Flavobacterium foetidum]